MTRRINSKALSDWLDNQPENARAALAVKAKVSPSFIDKVVSGNYQFKCRNHRAVRLLKATGLKASELFLKG